MMYRHPQATQTSHTSMWVFYLFIIFSGDCKVNREVKQFLSYKRSISNVCLILLVFTGSATNTQRDSYKGQ